MTSYHCCCFAITVSILCFIASCSKNEVTLHIQQVDSHTGYDLNRVFFVNDSVGYYCGGSRYTIGIVAHSTNGGASWSAVDSAFPNACYSSWFFNPADGFLGSYEGYIAQTTDTANTFTRSQVTFNIPIVSLAFRTRQLGVAVAGLGYTLSKIYTTQDGGATWAQAYSDSMHSLTSATFIDDTTVIAVGYGIILRSGNSGRSFTVVKENGDFYQSIDFATTQLGYTVGYQGEVSKTTDRGSSWVPVRSSNGLWSSADHLLSVDFVNEYVGYAVGETGFMIRTNNGGADWQTIKPFTDKRLKSIHLFSATAGIIVGEGGSVYLFKE